MFIAITEKNTYKKNAFFLDSILPVNIAAVILAINKIPKIMTFLLTSKKIVIVKKANNISADFNAALRKILVGS